MDYVSRLMANARIHLTGAVDEAIKVELFNAVDEFLRETNIWREDIPFVTVEGTDIVYDLVPTIGTILRLIDLYRDGTKVAALGYMAIPGELTLPTPWTAGTAMVATVSLAPLDPTVTGSDFPDIPTWVWQRHFQTLLHGVIYKMALQPGKPYTSNDLVLLHGNKFRNQISVARADDIKANTAGGQAWRFPNFAAQRNSSSQVN